LDWTDCNEVEAVPEKVSGAPVLRGTRMQADLVLDNHRVGLSAAEIANLYTLRTEQVQAVIDFAIRHSDA